MHIQSLGYNQGTAIVSFIINYVIKCGELSQAIRWPMPSYSQSGKHSKSSTAQRSMLGILNPSLSLPPPLAQPRLQCQKQTNSIVGCKLLLPIAQLRKPNCSFRRQPDTATCNQKQIAGLECFSVLSLFLQTNVIPVCTISLQMGK